MPRACTELTRQETAAPSRPLQQWRTATMTDIVQPLRHGRILGRRTRAKTPRHRRPGAAPHPQSRACGEPIRRRPGLTSFKSLRNSSAWTSPTSASATPSSTVSSYTILLTFPRPPLLLPRRLGSASLQLLLGGSPLASSPACVIYLDRALAIRIARENALSSNRCD